jgi:hypothetical protein
MKFTFRDLFLVTVIVALTVGWWVDRGRMAAEMSRLTEENRLLKIKPYYTMGPAPDYLSPKYRAPAPNPPKP